MEYTIEFKDLFDWEKESDRHYYMLLGLSNYEEEIINSSIIVESPKIEVKYETIIKPTKIRKSLRERLLIRSHLLTKAIRTKNRFKRS